MKKLYSLFAGLLIAGAVSAQCTVTYTYTTNGLTVNTSATGVGTAAFPMYGWDWGDATTPTVSQNGNHTYANAGTYQVCVYFFDLADTVNCNATSCQSISVTATGINSNNGLTTSISASPNPFSSTATFNVTLATSSEVEISVFDITGKQVAVVKDETMSAGVHQILWMPENLADGVYFVQMNVDGNVQTRKIVHTSK